MSSLSENPTRRALEMCASGQYRGESSGRDGYEQHDLHGWGAVHRMTASIARERRVEELRRSIHRCDEAPVTA